jgi:TetR/AcrR family transcriptional regulator
MVKQPKPARAALPGPDSDAEARILDAAHLVFVRRGTAGARMQEIADEAGVNKALLHYYFRSKDRLASAVFRRVARALFGRVAQVVQAELTLEDKVRHIIAVYLDQFLETPYVPAYLIGEMSQHPERASELLDALGVAKGPTAPPPFLVALGHQIQAAVTEGSVAPIPARQFLTNLVSLCIFPFAARPIVCAVFRLEDRGFRDFIAERKATLPDFFLNALRP